MSNHLEGCHIAITGTLSKVRKDIIKDIVNAGGTFSATVTGKTTHLVAANPYMDTVKFKNARALGAEIVGEDFLQTGKVAKVFGAEDRVERYDDADKAVTWQYKEYSDWSDYAEDAHGIVEAAYEDWLIDRTLPSRPIKSGAFIYKVNFDESTQQNMQVEPFTIREIRRCVGGVPTAIAPAPAKPTSVTKSSLKKHAKEEHEDEDEEEEEEKPKKTRSKKAAPKKTKKKANDDEEEKEDEEEDEEEKPKAKKAAPKKTGSKKRDKEDKEDKGAAKKAKGSGVFGGLVFAITGKLSQPRKDFEELIASNGGTVAKSVTKAVTHLIASASDKGSAKLDKAADNGVTVVSENFVTDAIEDGSIPSNLAAYLLW